MLLFSNECPTPVNSNACADNSKACLIDGTCYANGARRSSTGNGGCEVVLFRKYRKLRVLFWVVGMQQACLAIRVDGRFGRIVRRHASVHKRRPVQGRRLQRNGVHVPELRNVQRSRMHAELRPLPHRQSMPKQR